VAAEADATELEALLPRGFSLREPLLVVEGASLTRLPWLAGRGYNLVSVSVPVVFTTGAHDTAGSLELVTWEDLPDPIISGRDELGFNKVYADEISRDDTHERTVWSVSWGGTRFLEFEVGFEVVPDSQREPTWRGGPTFHYRVLARTGQWGELEVEQITANTATSTAMTLDASQRGEGRLSFTPATFDQLPTLVHIVNALSSLSLGPVLDAGRAELSGWSDVDDMRIVAAWPVAPPDIHSYS
jgi:hypothetical protein